MAFRAGKTAPRLIQDLLTYDPRYEDVARRNLLSSPPPHFDPDTTPQASVPRRNCRHNFMLKHEQSKEPIVGTDPTNETVYKVATFCQRCRWHVDVIVDFRNADAESSPCHLSIKEYPLHHFIFLGEDTQSTDAYGENNIPRAFRFKCSAPRCPVFLHISVRPQRFTDVDINLMTNATKLRQRLEAAKQLAGERADTNVARPIDALDYLNTYLADSLKPTKGKSRIPFLNRKFLKTFGQDCDRILVGLGFTHELEQNEDGEDISVWNLPQPPPSGDPLAENTLRTVIEDAQYELGALLLGFPEIDRIGIRNPIIAPQPAIKIVERALGSEEYPRKSPSGSRSSNKSEEDHPYYAGLGANGDFTDDLLLVAFTAQFKTDPSNATYYFECLQSIAIGRNSDELTTQVLILASRGHINRQEAKKAYEYFDINPRVADSLDDEHILQVFRARLPDIGPGQAQDARNTLRLIAYARNSDKIRQEASNTIDTYAQAWNYLGLGDEFPDDFVPTMVKVKLDEQNVDRETIFKAVRIIAEARNSQYLRDFAETGELPVTRDVGESYITLGILDRTEALDPETLRVLVDTLIMESPRDKDKYEAAYLDILKDQEDNPRMSHNGVVTKNKKRYPLETWPVGCLNIGNTCYLNSVLQFLFTIKPLREMVLNCEGYLQETTPQALAKKRVGRSAVPAEKVKQAQQFIYELRNLFHKMITADTDSIRPEMKLAALALSKDGDVTQSGPEQQDHEPGLGKLNGMAVIGPMPMPVPTPLSEPALAQQTEKANGDLANDITMGRASGTKSDTSSTHAEFDVDSDDPMSTSVLVKEPDAAAIPIPTRAAPPIPPRPQQQQPEIKKIEGLAQQQDAAEILNNVFDLLQCAIKPIDRFKDGEQYDLIKKLFFSDVTTVRTAADGNESRNSAVQDVQHISPGCNDRPLLAALDDEFSLTEFESESTGEKMTSSKYEFINRASPIQIINVRRLLYEGGKSKKDESHVGLEDVIYLDRYLRATNSLNQEQLLQLRQEQWDIQRKLRDTETRIEELRKTEVKASLPDVVAETATLVERLYVNENLIDLEDDTQDPPMFIDPGLPIQLRERVRELDGEIKILEGQMAELKSQSRHVFEHCKDHPYRLHSVFMHRGSSVGGHYWIYIYDFQNKVWREYNDETVSEVEDPINAIFRKEDNMHPGTSTGVVYVQETEIDQLTEAVNRRPRFSADGDVEMKDVGNETEYRDVQIINGVAAPT